MPDKNPCEICGTMSEAIRSGDDEIYQKCPYCGEFKLTGTAPSLVQGLDAAVKTRISGWVLDQNRNRTVPTISSGVLKNVAARALPTFTERANRLLLEALQQQERVGESIDISEPRFLNATYSQDANEVDLLARLLSDKGLMKGMDIANKSGGVVSSYDVLPRGYAAADELTLRVPQSDKGFVAMSFSENLKPVYEKGFQVGITNAGYDPDRADKGEYTNRIDDEIIARIRTAVFVVADFTGHRGGVYFEAGFALGLDLPVIWTCRKDDIKDLHFDIRQYNTIDWETPEELSTRLQRRIEATVGKGPGIVLAMRPDVKTEEIDYSKTTDEEILTGEVTLKSGQTVRIL